MSITNSTAAKNAATDAVTGLIGTTGGLQILDATAVVLASFALGATPFGASAAGTATAAAITSVSAAAAGTAASYQALDSTGTLVWSGSVTAAGGGGDMELDNTVIASGQTVSISSWTHTALSA